MSTRMGRSPISKTREGNENEPYQYAHVDEKKFKSSDHRELSAYQVQRSLIRAKILREVVNDIYRKHYFPVTEESTIMFEYDRNKDEIKEPVALSTRTKVIPAVKPMPRVGVKAMPRIPDQASRTFPKGIQHGYSYVSGPSPSSWTRTPTRTRSGRGPAPQPAALPAATRVLAMEDL